MDIFTISKDSSARNDNLHLMMDYDSGYISHNPESNLDSSLEISDDNLQKGDECKPVYLSEDALLETPISNKYLNSNVSMEIENEDYEEARNLFNMLDCEESEIPSSASSHGSRLIAFSESSESERSIEISPAKPLIFDSKREDNVRSSLICRLPLSFLKDSPILQTLQKGNTATPELNKNNIPQPNNFSGRLESNKKNTSQPSLICCVPLETIRKMDDPKKKLTLIFSKANENSYSVKRKYQSISPNKNESLISNSLEKSLGQQSDFGSSTSSEISSLDTTQENESSDESYYQEQPADEPKQQDLKPLKSNEYPDTLSVVGENQQIKVSDDNVSNVQHSLINPAAVDGENLERNSFSRLSHIQETTEVDQIRDITDSKQIPMQSEAVNVHESSIEEEEESLEAQLQEALKRSIIMEMDGDVVEQKKAHEINASCTLSQIDGKIGIPLINESSEVQIEDSMEQVSTEVRNTNEYLQLQISSVSNVELVPSGLNIDSLQLTEARTQIEGTQPQESSKLSQQLHVSNNSSEICQVNETLIVDFSEGMNQETHTEELTPSLLQPTVEQSLEPFVVDQQSVMNDSSVISQLDKTVNVKSAEEAKQEMHTNVHAPSLIQRTVEQSLEPLEVPQQKRVVNDFCGILQFNTTLKVDSAEGMNQPVHTNELAHSLLQPVVEQGQLQGSSHTQASQLKEATGLDISEDRIPVQTKQKLIDKSVVEHTQAMEASGCYDNEIEMLKASVASSSPERQNISRTHVQRNSLPNCSTRMTRIRQNSFSRNNIFSKLESTRKEPPSLCDISVIGASYTPKKVYVNKVNPDVSPDLFSDDEATPEPAAMTSQLQNYIAKEQFIMKKDERILRRTQNSLKGVLPPRSITVCQISVNEMLNRLEINKEYYWSSTVATKCGDIKEESMVNCSGESSFCGESKSLLVNSMLDEAKNAEFPQILKLRNHGLYHNRSKLSEELEELCVKFGERYVGAETQSSCTIFETNCPSPRKRLGAAAKARWSAKSPGRRLSHLARRRITFSSANLQAAGSSSSSAFAGVRARQILVDAKKLDMLNIRRSPRKTPKKTPSKSPMKRTRTPSSSAKKKLALRFRRLTGEIECTEGPSHQSEKQLMMPSKRALFTSPEKKKENTIFSQSSTFSLSSISRSPFKRLDIGFDKKRKRDDDLEDARHPSKIPRSMSMEVKSSDASQSLCRTKSDGILSVKAPPQDLSVAHRKKLQWAVYEALRAHNVGPTHENFKMFASILARAVRRLIYHMNSAVSGPLVGTTSERMLRFARRHVLAVIKGASVEEIIAEYSKMQQKQRKPQGYIGIEEFNAVKDKENQVQERTRGLESLEKRRLDELHKPKLRSDNRIERIRKVINFGDDDR